MPVTVEISDVQPGHYWAKNVPTVTKLFEEAAAKEFKKCKQMFQSSISNDFLSQNHIAPSKNGLVYSILSAWSDHYHLTLRPEDVWFAILNQLSFYINAHAEELREFFVSHDGQIKLEVEREGSIKTVDLGSMAVEMTDKMQKKINDPELRAWVMPDFSTTTTTDRVVAAVQMMGALQTYFSYKFILGCGLPSVTLLGTQADWATLLAKVDKIPQLGKEPQHFARLLTPVLKRFVRTFESPQNPEVATFWEKCAHMNGGSGVICLSGWVTAFCFWNEKGECLYPEHIEYEVSLNSRRTNVAGCNLDGFYFHRVETNSIPSGYATVPVIVNDNGTIYNTRMLAGSIAIRASRSSAALTDAAHRTDAAAQPSRDCVQPVTAWWIYEIVGNNDLEEREKEILKIEEELQMLQDSSYYVRSEKDRRRAISDLYDKQMRLMDL